MWCRHCLREVSPGQSSSAPVVCPFCGRSVEAVSAQSQAVRQAREILERWQASDLFDRITSSDVIPENKQQARVVPPALPQPEKIRTEPPRRPSPEALPRLPQPAETQQQSRTGMDWRKAAREVQERPQPRTVVPRTTTAETPEPSSRSVIRELPQLPLDLLAPAPVMAAANSTNSTPPQTAARTSVPVDEWEPPPRYIEDTSEETSAPDSSSNSEKDSAAAAAIEAFFEASAADLFSAAEEQTPAANARSSDTPQDVPLTPFVAPAATPAAKPGIVSEVSDRPETMEQKPIPDEPPVAFAGSKQSREVEPLPDHSVGEQQSSVPDSSSDTQEAATGDAPVILQTTSPRPRPALRRPPLNRRISAQQDPVQPISGTIPMNRNTTTEASSQQPGVPAPVIVPAIAPPVAHSTAPVTAPAAASITAPSATPFTTPVTGSLAAPSMAPSVASVAPAIVSNSSESGVRERRDAAEPMQSERPHMTGWVRPPQRYIDEPHQPPVRGPHFEISPPPRSNFTTMIGQGLAYTGVIALLIGTSLVILGHFGGESDYTPTGWLVTTVAQMLLFLGIINLVSGGMEQHNDEVARRIHSLSEHLIRIEQTTAEAVMAARHAGSERTDSVEVTAKTPAAERVSGERRTAQHA